MLPVYLEVAPRRSFAAACDWPGWCRSGRTEELALAALADYLPRYAAAAARASVQLPAADADALEVVERLTGSMTTEYGAPGAVAAGDGEPLTVADAARQARLVAAAWTALDRVAAGAPAELRKGPRGGGRDRDQVVEHVLSAEAAYARKIGVRLLVPAVGDRASVDALRSAVLAVLGGPSDGLPVGAKGWPVRYAARRIAWHVLDHAWEIEDKSGPAATAP
ncbi:MAG: hypothetical protein M3Z02_06945 [Actinomycetota bacterium]|nr:hypothetical protein [Actinomycetota bacterium]